MLRRAPIRPAVLLELKPSEIRPDSQYYPSKVTEKQRIIMLARLPGEKRVSLADPRFSAFDGFIDNECSAPRRNMADAIQH